MKKIAITFLMFLVAVGLFATAQQEVTDTPEPIEISILYSGVADYGDFTNLSWAIEQLQKDFDGATVREMQVDLSDGSALTMTAQIAAGQAPNLYMDTLVRSSAYITPDYALPLDAYVRDLEAYSESTLAPYRRGGQLYALPMTGSAQAMAINLEILKEVGYTLPDRWTTDDFMDLARAVRLKYGGEKWVTGMFAGNQSGDYLINNWFASFGAQYYKPGDYSRTTIKETGGVKFYEALQMMVEEGFVRADAATQVDDDYVLDWARGDLAATAFFQPWIKPYFDVVIKAGDRDEPFEYMFTSFPRAPGVPYVPAYYVNAAIVVHNTGSAEDPVAARLAEYLNSKFIQEAEVLKSNSLPSRNDCTVFPNDPWTRQIMQVVADNGIFDAGLTNEKYQATRPQHYPILQKVLNLQMTPEEAITEYEKRLNEALE